MMQKLFALLAVLACLLGCLAGCQSGGDTTEPSTTETTAPSGEFIDYAGLVKLDLTSETKKMEVTVKTFIDGDTTHFYAPGIMDRGFVKARYLAVNTPESTGKIEEWGKKASNFTKEKLQSAVSIYIESDDANWNLDSTGDRHLLWVWYKSAGSDTYRNLNIELLQEGLSVASKSAETRYGETCMAAIAQAKANKLHIHSGESDPDFYYGGAMPITLKELRTNISAYENTKVAFEAVVTSEAPQTVYVEEYDSETDMYYGMTVYYGYGLTGKGLKILTPGNRILVVGSVQYYATGGTWQVSDIQYLMMRPDDPMNIRLIEEGHEASYRVTDAATFVSSMDIEVLASSDSGETEIKTVPWAQMALNSTISMENLTVTRIYTTQNEESANNGAMTLTCKAPGGVTISVRTAVLLDESGNKITADAYEGKNITVKGIIDYYSGSYQIKVLTADDITINS